MRLDSSLERIKYLDDIAIEYVSIKILISTYVKVLDSTGFYWD